MLTEPWVRNKFDCATSAVEITDALATHDRCVGFYVGISGDYDLSFDGSTWVAFPGLLSGSTYPFMVKGARQTSGAAAPAATAITFLYFAKQD
jgi:hypothetical protein